MKSRGYGICPSCDHECWIDADHGKEPNLIELKNRHKTDTDYGPGENWTEVFRCPKCQTVFEERNGYP